MAGAPNKPAAEQAPPSADEPRAPVLDAAAFFVPPSAVASLVSECAITQLQSCDFCGRCRSARPHPSSTPSAATSWLSPEHALFLAFAI